MCAPRSISAPIIAACWWRAGAATGSTSSTPSRASCGWARGWPRSGRLSEAAMDRTIAALERLRRQGGAQRRRAGRAMSRPRPAAAPPIAPSSSSACARDTGIPIEIISSDEEARLVVAGCAPLLDRRTCPTRWSSTSAAARPSWSGSSLRGERPRRSSGFVSVPHGVVTLGRPLWRPRRDARRSMPPWSTEMRARAGAVRGAARDIAAAIAAGAGAAARQLRHGDDARRRPSRSAAL